RGGGRRAGGAQVRLRRRHGARARGGHLHGDGRSARAGRQPAGAVVGTLLVALDGSPRARGVLAAALSLARRMVARIVLVPATSTSGELPSEAYASDPEAIARVLEQRATSELRALA